MQALSYKKEVLEWLSKENDPKIWEYLYLFQKQKQLDFDDEINRALSSDEFKHRTTEYLKSLNWKK